jgi:hypothetical protein
LNNIIIINKHKRNACGVVTFDIVAYVSTAAHPTFAAVCHTELFFSFILMCTPRAYFVYDAFRPFIYLYIVFFYLPRVLIVSRSKLVVKWSMFIILLSDCVPNAGERKKNVYKLYRMCPAGMVREKKTDFKRYTYLYDCETT